jgi:hypothetical protein
MRELDKQSSKKSTQRHLDGETYIIKNPYCDSAYELNDKLAKQIYDSIRKSDMDIWHIAKNLGFKTDNIKNLKDHVFYNKDNLDRYDPDQIEYKRFDASLSKALACKRLETGTYTPDYITWIKDECADRQNELKYGSGYSEAHDHAQSRFDIAPWVTIYIKIKFIKMGFSRKGNIYIITQMTGNRDNILGFYFANNKIEIID